MSIGIILGDDLIFTSKIVATARANGVIAISAKTSADAINKREINNAKSIIVDLNLPGLNIEEFVLAAKCKVIGYGSHVDVESLKAARKAGCQAVMPRSQFVELIETHITDWFS